MVSPSAKILVVPLGENWPDVAARVTEGVLVGVHPEWDVIDAARALAEARGWTHCLFIEGSLEAIPWQNAYFTHAVVQGEPSRDVYRVLVPGGEILA